LSKEAHPASIESARSKRASLSGSQDFTEQILTAFCTSASLTTYFGDSNPFTEVAIKLNLHAHFASRQFVYWSFDAVIAAEDLRFDFIPSKDGKPAKERETKLHQAFRKKVS